MKTDAVTRIHQGQSQSYVCGFTLIEVLVSMLIFSVIIGSMPSAFMAHLRYNQNAEIKTSSLLVAQRILDDYRIQDPSSLPISGEQTFSGLSVNGYNFDAKAYFCLEASYCLAATNRHIRVEVSYDSNVVYGVETVFTRLR